MGFGKSETPQDKEYTLKTHVENLSNLIEFLDLKNITLLAKIGRANNRRIFN